MTYEPHCQMSWTEMMAGADDQGRTVETVMAELNTALTTVKEIEAMTPPHSELVQMRKQTAEYIAWRAINEANAALDARAAIKQAKGKP